jgi:hypothetical protein
MSERTRGLPTTGAHHEVNDLKELHASKTQESLRQEITGAANTDLSSASIQSISVVRLSARPEKRKVAALTTPDLDPTAERKAQSRDGTPRAINHGILRNPYFPYQGNPLERLVTLLANVLKYFERSLLASLRPQAPQPQPLKPVNKAKRKDSLGREIEEEEEERQERKQESLDNKAPLSTSLE